jgi:hypothetical protein
VGTWAAQEDPRRCDAYRADDSPPVFSEQGAHMNVPFDLVSIDFDSIIAGRFCSGELGRVAYPVPLL